MDVIKKCKKYYKQLLDEKAQWETVSEKTGDKSSCAEKLDEINKQIEFLKKAFEINNIKYERK
jgi:hypothetical protein